MNISECAGSDHCGAVILVINSTYQLHSLSLRIFLVWRRASPETCRREKVAGKESVYVFVHPVT